MFSNPRAHVITRAAGRGWRSEPVAWSLERIAAAIADPTEIVGIRPEGLIRLGVVDIDRKPDRVSPYWHPVGRGRHLKALEAAAEEAGCRLSVVRSSASGGLHALITFPEPVKAWRAHWLLAELVHRAGMEQGAGRCELFPSRIDYSANSDRSTWGQSHGCRLPGQEGSALLVGDRSASDTDLIYASLLEDLEGTEACLGWEELQEAATARCRASRGSRGRGMGHRFRKATLRALRIRWVSSGQSNGNLAAITGWVRAAHPRATTVEELAPLIAAAARGAEGFAEHASDVSQKDLEGWARRWAAWSLRRDRAPGAPAPSTDRHHNKRLAQRSRASLTRLWRSLKAAARELSQRAVAEQAGLNRKTVRHHWDYWLQLLGGPDPLLTGGAVPAVASESFEPAVSVPPAAPAQSVTSGATTSPEAPPPRQDPPERLRRRLSWLSGGPAAPASAESPFKATAAPADAWRERQRAELLAWIGAN